MMNNIYLARAKTALVKNSYFDIDHFPALISSARGCRLIDESGNEYLDISNPHNLFGYGCPQISNERIKYILQGDGHTIPHYAHLLAAERIKEIFPFCDKVRFFPSYKEASDAAKSYSIMSNARESHFENSKALRWLYDQDSVSNVNVSSINFDFTKVILNKESLAFTNNALEFCKKHEVVSIMDESNTILQYPKLSVCRYHGLEPDLVLLGNSTANGANIGILAGKSDIMDVFEFNILSCSNNPPSLGSIISAHAALTLSKKDANYDVENLLSESERFFETLNEVSPMWNIESFRNSGYFTGLSASLAGRLRMAKVIVGNSIHVTYPMLDELDELIYLFNSV